MRGEGRQEVRVTQLLLYPLLSVAKTRGSSQEETVAFVGVRWEHGGALRCLSTCGLHFCSLDFACGGFSNLFVSGRCANIWACGVASVHAARAQTDGIKATVSYFPCGFISSVGEWSSTWIHLAWCLWQPSWPPCFSPFCPPHLRSPRQTVPVTPTEKLADAHKACLLSAKLRIYTSNSERFLSRACVSQCFLSFIEYLNKKNIWKRVPSPHSVFPLLSLRGLWSHLWHNSSISKPNITVSTSETSRLCSVEGYVGVCDLFF